MFRITSGTRLALYWAVGGVLLSAAVDAGPGLVNPVPLGRLSPPMMRNSVCSVKTNTCPDMDCRQNIGDGKNGDNCIVGNFNVGTPDSPRNRRAIICLPGNFVSARFVSNRHEGRRCERGHSGADCTSVYRRCGTYFLYSEAQCRGKVWKGDGHLAECLDPRENPNGGPRSEDDPGGTPPDFDVTVEFNDDPPDPYYDYPRPLSRWPWTDMTDVSED